MTKYTKSYINEKNKRHLNQENVLKQRVIDQHIDGEIWKITYGFSKYECSTLGRIRNIKTKLLLKPYIERGYEVASLMDDNGIRIPIRFHRIIAQTFIENPDNKETVNHKDKNRANNNLLNLEWATNHEQMVHVQAVNPPPKLERKKFVELNNIDGEIWKPIINYNNYFVSNLGRIQIRRKTVTTKVSEGHLRNDYLSFTLANKDGRKDMFIHRLVAMAFLENPEGHPIVNHKDGEKLNNKLINLEWSTYSLNATHAYENNLNSKRCTIYQLDENNGIIKKWDSIIEASNSLNINKKCISAVINKRRITAGGFYWELVSNYNADNKLKIIPKYNSIKQIDKESNLLIKTWDDKKEAIKYISQVNNNSLENVRSGINSCLNGRNTSAFGYFWQNEKLEVTY